MESAVQVQQPLQSDDQSVKRRAACDECRTKKLKCSGHQPSCLRCQREGLECIYSPQKQMGRPKKRQTDGAEPTNHKKTRTSLPAAQSDFGNDANSFDLAQLQDAFTPGGNMQPWLQGDWSASNDVMNTTSGLELNSVPGLTPDTSSHSNSPPILNLPAELRSGRSSITGHDHAAPHHGDAGTSLLLDPTLAAANSSAGMPLRLLPNCACLSTLYLTLSSLQAMDNDFTFPFSLHPLREAMSTASAVLKCEECPTRFITAIQNTQLVGTLLMSIAERFSKVLEHISTEANRAAGAGETKKFRLADLNTSTSHLHTNGLGCVAAFSINLSPDEWKNMCKKVVRVEVYGPEDGSEQCCPYFTGICEQMTQRQERWHKSPVPDDFPKDQTGAPIGGPRDVAGPGHGKEHLCLKLVKYAYSLIDNFDWN